MQAEEVVTFFGVPGLGCADWGQVVRIAVSWLHFHRAGSALPNDAFSLCTMNVIKHQPTTNTGGEMCLQHRPSR